MEKSSNSGATISLFSIVQDSRSERKTSRLPPPPILAFINKKDTHCQGRHMGLWLSLLLGVKNKKKGLYSSRLAEKPEAFSHSCDHVHPMLTNDRCRWEEKV